ncbi:hypothetical protein [Streptomyces sp. NRRL WC-3742]|uniref:hypothetical protein n=1 Tax=Streptomyces sp. NRRL WC-3742 TaxID=1463934 RepID=UPI0004C70921|nr:hypothetical protein [Streptomyces sp. NRRL WC-3742]
MIPNSERVAQGAQALNVFTVKADSVGAGCFCLAERAYVGQMMAAEYVVRTFTPQEREELGSDLMAMVLGDLAADLFHAAHGTITPGALIKYSLIELTRTVNMVPVLCRLGDEGRAELFVGALASVLAFAELEGIAPSEITDHAFSCFEQEISQEDWLRRQES